AAWGAEAVDARGDGRKIPTHAKSQANGGTCGEIRRACEIARDANSIRSAQSHDHPRRGSDSAADGADGVAGDHASPRFAAATVRFLLHLLGLLLEIREPAAELRSLRRLIFFRRLLFRRHAGIDDHLAGFLG